MDTIGWNLVTAIRQTRLTVMVRSWTPGQAGTLTTNDGFGVSNST